MNFVLNIFASVLLLSGSLNLFIALLLFQRLENRLKPFCYIMMSISVWAISYGLQLSSKNYEQILFCTYLEYIGIALTPAFWSLAVIRFVGKDKWLHPRNYLLLFLIPAITLLLVFTNDHHHLFYSHLELVTYRGLAFLEVGKGPWYVINTGYFYVMLLWGLYLLMNQLKNEDKIYKKQRNIIVVGAVGPWVFNIIYQLGFKPLNHLDLTPYSFILTSIIVSVGFFRYRLFNIAPIAKEKVFDAMQEGVLVLDRRLRIVGLNHEMKSILNSETEVIGIEADYVFGGKPELRELASRSSNGKINVEYNTGDKIRHFEIASSSLFEDNVFTGKILLFKDVSEFHAGERIRLLMQKKDDFLSIASHELKTPLTTMKGYLRIAGTIAEKEGSSQCGEFIRKAEKQTDKLTSLINDLLDVSKIESGKMPYHFTSFKIGEVITDCIDFANNTSSDHIVILEGDSEIEVQADRNRIEQVICNLLSNAIKYSPESPVVTINVTKDREDLVVSVKDNGIGIPPEKQEKLFEKFYRVEKTEQRFTGLGIGLFIANEIVLRHSGKLWIESHPGTGSTFSFSVPLKNITTG